MEKVRILLVDDQPSRLLSYEAILDELGETLVRAQSGQEALQLLMKHDFAVILLDVNMPGMDGFETAHMIHQHPRYETTPIIFVTAVHMTDMDRLRGYKLGAVDYVYIPVIPEILRSKVAVLVELYRNRRELVRMNSSLQNSNEELAGANELLRAERTRELQEVNRTLEEANARLEEANASLSEAATRKDEFLAMLAHELRNPLNPVRNVLEVMRLDASPARYEWGRNIIDKQVQHLTRLIDDLLDVNRITRDRLVLVRETANLRDIILTAIETSIDMNGEHRFTSVVPEEPILVQGDIVRLTQVFVNILNNATKFTPPGGAISLHVERPEQNMAIGFCRITIRDEGLGIPPDELPRLFDLFYQSDSSRERTQGGLGIGLTLVRRLVELHGGTVEATSDGIGRGSEFVVALPTIGAPVAERKTTPSLQANGAPARRVLVVDDNPDSVETLARLLQLRGNNVVQASSGEEAIQLARTFNPEIMLLDIGMPGLSGHEVARRIRAESWGRDITLIALTGWGTDHDRQLSREAGFNHHLVKPLNIADLDGVLAGGR